MTNEELQLKKKDILSGLNGLKEVIAVAKENIKRGLSTEENLRGYEFTYKVLKEYYDPLLGET